MKIKELKEKAEYKNFMVKVKTFLFGNGVKEGKIFNILLYVIVLALGFIFLYPIIYMISMSLMDLDDLLDSQISWIPSHLYLDNYRLAIKALGLPKALWDSLKVVLIPAVLSTVSSCLIGYGFSRFKFPGKNVLFVILILVYIVPSQITILPQFAWFKKLGLLGTLWTFILPATFGQGLFSTIYILIFYSFFNMIPKALDEAAFIDGASEIKVFYEVGLKLSLQPFIICIAFSFVWYWNDLYHASYFLAQSDSKTRTLIQMLNIFENSYLQLEEVSEMQIKANEPVTLAGTLISIFPLLVVYFFLQKYFVESVDSTGITGE